jgi:predicted peroxiredoxin
VKRVLSVLVIAIFVMGGSAFGADKKMGLFVNLTTDDTWNACKAISFAKNKSLANGHKTVIWLNARGVYLADKRRVSVSPNMMGHTTLAEALQSFIKDGGEVYVCQLCAKKAGLTQDDLIKGVKIGKEEIILPYVFSHDMKTLSW